MGQVLDRPQELLSSFGPSVLQALYILFFGWIAMRILRGVLRRIMNRAKLDPTLTGFVANMLYAVLMTLVVITALQKLGVPTTSFVAIIGAAGLASGFALRGSLANFAAGVMVIIFRPFKVGDYIEGGGVNGTVAELQVFSTVLNTPDNRRIIVPNSALTGGVITNYSANDTRRIELTFGISYGDDMAKAKGVLRELVSKDEHILKDPETAIAVAELADSSVNLVCRPWVKTAD
jgi:small conductance mechanosensitive channel